jgi:hypothetical protein
MAWFSDYLMQGLTDKELRNTLFYVSQMQNTKDDAVPFTPYLHHN